MSDAEVRVSLAKAQEHIGIGQRYIDEALARLGPPPPSVVQVNPSDNLESLIEANPPGTTFEVAREWVGGALTISKPCVVQAKGPLPSGRVESHWSLPMVNAQLTVAAPNVTLVGLKVQGVARDWTLLRANHPDLVADRCMLTGSLNGQKRGIDVRGARQAYVGCRIENCWHDADAQAIYTESGADVLTIHDCYLEASGENFMAGGGDSGSFALVPRGIRITNSHLRKPLEWRGKPGCSVKNLLELKNVIGFHMENCLLENNWKASQTGYAIVMAVRNQTGREPWSTIKSVMLKNNVLRGCGAGLSFLARDYTYESGRMSDVTVSGLRIEDFSQKSWASAGGSAAAGRILQINRGPKNLVIDDLTVDAVGPSPLQCAIEFIDPTNPLEGFALRRAHLWEGPYGVQHDGENWGSTQPPMRGTPTLEAFNPGGYEWEGVTIVRNAGARWFYPHNTMIVVP